LVSLRGAERRSNLRAGHEARQTHRLPRLPLAGLGEWLEMTGSGVLEARSLDSRLRGNDTRGCEGLVPAGSLRVCLSPSPSSSPVKGEESRPTGMCRGAKPLCRGFGGVPQFPLLSPKTGGQRGLMTHMSVIREARDGMAPRHQAYESWLCPISRSWKR
jgi:hypothetical protein